MNPKNARKCGNKRKLNHFIELNDTFLSSSIAEKECETVPSNLIMSFHYVPFFFVEEEEETRRLRHELK